MDEIKITPKNLKAYKDLKSEAVNAFSRGDYEQALDYAYSAATLTWNDFGIGIWYDDELEHLLSKINKYTISEEENNYEKGEGEKQSKYRITKKIVYIASHLYDIGGHSRVLEQWVNLLADSFDEQYVYITNVTNVPTTSPHIINKLKGNGAIIKQLPFDDSRTSRIKILTGWIERDSPDVIILFIHPNDVIVVSSLFSLANKPYTIFFNHADHVFWLGRNIIDLIIEYRTMGARLSKKLRKIDRIDIIPLTTNIRPQRVTKTAYNIPETATISVSIGSFYKVIGDPEMDYFETIRELLEMSPNHYHLLVTNPPSQNTLEKYLPDDQDVRKRLIVMGPFSNLEPIYGVADFLVETFPFIGGAVRVEAMACGLPIVAFRNKKALRLTETDALPPDYQFIASTTSDVVKYSLEFIQNLELRRDIGNWLYEYYEQNFSPEKIHERLIDSVIKRDGKNAFTANAQHIGIGEFDCDTTYIYFLSQAQQQDAQINQLQEEAQQKDAQITQLQEEINKMLQLKSVRLHRKFESMLRKIRLRQ